MSLRTAASIFKCFINIFVNYISSPPKYTRARSAGPSLEEQSCRSPSPSWLIVVAGVWNMADNASDGRVHVSRSTGRGKSDKSMFGGGNGDCCGYLSSSSCRAAPRNYGLDAQRPLLAHQCYSLLYEECPTDWGGHGVLGTFGEEGSGWVRPVLDRPLSSFRTVVVEVKKTDDSKSCSESRLDVCYNKG